MRKYTIGFLIGIVLTITSTTYAVPIKSYIGKVIQGEFIVRINGEPLAKKAIVIEGASYIPVREIGDALGYEVSFDSAKGIDLWNIEHAPIPEITPIGKPTVTEAVYSLKEINHYIMTSNKFISYMKQTIAINPDDPNVPFQRTQLQMYEDELVLWEKRRAELIK